MIRASFSQFASPNHTTRAYNIMYVLVFILGITHRIVSLYVFFWLYKCSAHGKPIFKKHFMLNFNLLHQFARKFRPNVEGGLAFYIYFFFVFIKTIQPQWGSRHFYISSDLKTYQSDAAFLSIRWGLLGTMLKIPPPT